VPDADAGAAVVGFCQRICKRAVSVKYGAWIDAIKATVAAERDFGSPRVEREVRYGNT
jgi:hypothetical protein